MGLGPIIRALEAQNGILPMHQIIAFPHHESFVMAGGVAIINSVIQQNLGITDLCNFRNDHMDLHRPLSFNGFSIGCIIAQSRLHNKAKIGKCRLDKVQGNAYDELDLTLHTYDF